MVWYPDRRRRYLGKSPMDFSSGIPKADNPVKNAEPRINSAKREVAPGEHFRDTTAPKLPTVKPPESQPVPSPLPEAPQSIMNILAKDEPPTK